MKKLAQIVVLVTTFSIFLACSKDDTPPMEIAELNVSASSLSVTEGNTITFRFSLTTPVNEPLSLQFQLSGSATHGTDYELSKSTLIIDANQLSQTLDLTALEDEQEESTEEVTITLLDTDNPLIGISQSSVTIQLLDNPPAMQLSPGETRSYMVNPNATDETVALFYNLKVSSNSSFIVGQQDAFSLFFADNTGDSDMKKTTGSDPGLLGSDFMFITSDRNNGTPNNWFYQQEQLIKSDVIEAYNKGMVNSFSWHLNEPYNGNDFYTSNMTTFQKENAFKSILPGASNHEYYKQKLDKVAEVVKSIRGNDGKLVPIIFRPFHEFDGHWFWWGQDYCTAEEFITVWRFTVEYLRDEKGVNNMLFAFSPDNSYSTRAGYLSRYPGDDYVDILGMDNYGDLNNQGSDGMNRANQKLKMLSDLAIEKVKIAALTETGFFVTPGQNEPIAQFYSEILYNTLTNNDLEISFMMFWSNYTDVYCTPTPGQSDAEDFRKFADEPKTILAEDLPDMYVLPSSG